jgi:peptidoglycan/xylan/chitin deacetylase (PgdA/CDA1 family)
MVALVAGSLVLGLGDGPATAAVTPGRAVAATPAQPVAATASQPTTPTEAQAISRIATEEKVLALTFDAGSDAGHTLAILDILDAEQVKATFFVTASWLDKYPDLGAAIASRGHCLGNHTGSHPHLTTLTDDQIREELTSTEERAQSACGRSTRPFFRPPFGEYDQRVSRLIAEAGYDYMILWTIDSLDWKMISAEELTRRIVDGAEPGAIVLMHVGSQTNEPEALPETIRQLKAKGYRFATLSELLPGETPQGVTRYTVKTGDTLSSIARRFGIDLGDIVKTNGLENADTIKVGQILISPKPAGGSGGQGDQGGWGGDDGSGGAGGDDGQGGADGSSDGSGQGRGLLARFWVALGRAWDQLRGLLARLVGR